MRTKLSQPKPAPRGAADLAWGLSEDVGDGACDGCGRLVVEPLDLRSLACPRF